MKKLTLRRQAYNIVKENSKTEIYSDFYKSETPQEIVLLYGDVVVGVYSKRTGSLYTFTMYDVAVRNKLYAFARKVNVIRVVHLYFRSDCVLETYIDGRTPWSVTKDVYYREYHNDFNTQIQNNWW
jgi:hypothetical protein